MTDLEIAHAIRDAYNKWRPADDAAFPEPAVSERPADPTAQLDAMAGDPDSDEAEMGRIRREYLDGMARHEAEMLAWEQAALAREERWAARRAEFLTELGVG